MGCAGGEEQSEHEFSPLQLLVCHVGQYFSVDIVFRNNLLVLIDLAPEFRPARLEKVHHV
jgi:hypothetical protein